MSKNNNLLNDLADIVAQATFLSDRLESVSNEDSQELLNKDSWDETLSNKRLQTWLESGFQNWQHFERRLSWAGLDLEKARHILGTTVKPNVDSMPSWAHTLKAIVELTAAFNSMGTVIAETHLPIKDSKPLAFEDALLPVVLVARQKLLESLGITALSSDCFGVISVKAYSDLERTLLVRLSNISNRALGFEFLKSRSLDKVKISIAEGKGESKEDYSRFVADVLQDGLLSFFKTYPVLGYFVATAVDLWIDATREFLQRLKADMPEISQAFVGGTCSSVDEIETWLSDPHKGGRTTMIVKFSSGEKLVYKPKDLGLDVAYNNFLLWCNQQGISDFKVLNIIHKGSYGWAEYVEQLPCDDSEGARRFYHRAGMLLCVLYLLKATDCHYENAIASGEHLVLIDVETVIQPKQKKLEHFPEIAAANRSAVHQMFFQSVIFTGLLPMWYLSKSSGVPIDVSALGGVDEQTRKSQPTPGWEFINTDDMRLEYKELPLPPKKNAPVLNGRNLNPNDYVEEMVLGFQQMYCFLLKSQEMLLATDESPLAAFKDQNFRFLFRATDMYDTFLRESLVPKFLKSGIDWGIKMDVLNFLYTREENKPATWTLLADETRSLEQLDIPHFGGLTESVDLTRGVKEPVKEYFSEAACARIEKQLQKLGEFDLKLQVRLIRDSFYSKLGQLHTLNESATPVPPLLKGGLGGDLPGPLSFPLALGLGTQEEQEENLPAAAPVPPLLKGGLGGDLPGFEQLTSEELLIEALNIAEQIASQAIGGIDNKINWIGLTYKPAIQKYDHDILGEVLYDGNCGIALYLAALAKVTGESRWKKLALMALEALHGFLTLRGEKTTKLFVRVLGIGGTIGLGSMVYGLVRISQFLRESKPLEDALEVASLISPATIEGDRFLDVAAGAAGAILGLLALYDATGSSAILDKAILCGQHLLQNRVSVGVCVACAERVAPRAWRTMTSVSEPITGFSHGAAGIAYALLRLYAVTQDAEYLDAAREGIAYELSVFSPTAGNWPDFRSFVGVQAPPAGVRSQAEPGNERGGERGERRESQRQKFMVSWCHGAPGIGLARLGGKSILDTPDIRQDIEVALQTTLNYGLRSLDNLCCGNFGRIETLLVGARELNRPELETSALLLATRAIAAARQAGGYRLYTNVPKIIYSPMFFLGTAGIGYQLLRFVDQKLPSALLWQ